MNRNETPLSVNQQIETLERVIELVQYNIENERNSDLDEIIHEVADTIVSPYYTEQVQQWVEMGAPEPDDWAVENNDHMPIHTLITWAIVQTVTEHLYSVIDDIHTPIDETHDTLRAELDRLRVARGYATLAKAIIE